MPQRQALTATIIVPRRFRSILVCTSIAILLFYWHIQSIHRRTWSAVLPEPSTAAELTRQSTDVSGATPAREEVQQLQQTYKLENQNAQAPIPVIIFTFNRANYLRRTIDSVLAALPSDPRLHPIFVSQDGNDANVTAAIASYGERLVPLNFTWHGQPRSKVRTAYLKIADHYRFALTEVMDNIAGHERWDRVIMLEDDMLVSPDIFPYFRRMSPLFDTDPTVYCVSAWNSNGQSSFVTMPTAVYRTDCFPGLGWMWSRELWNEMREWTSGFWDDWLREAPQRKGRSCVYPEINRVYTFGRVGSSSGQFFDRYLKNIRLNDERVEWGEVDIDRLQKHRYDEWMTKQLRTAIQVDGVEDAKAAVDYELDHVGMAVVNTPERWFNYSGLQNLTEIIKPLGLQTDHKAGIPRASYRGVLQFRYRGVKIWIVPDSISLPFK